MVSGTKKIALGGMLCVLCIFSLYLAVHLPTNRIFFYGLSSVFASIIMIEGGTKWAFIFYGATSILGMLLIPNKLGVVPYGLFFGLYGIVKYYIEGIANIILQLLLKGGFFILGMGGTAILLQELFMTEVTSRLSIWALTVIGLAIFYLYDYVYTRFVHYYETVLRKKL
ncbi:hypothetical protein OXPF_30450 [Oxobacter pfennigii]|uniref:Uncharacterized protein n=1 Tax=Oxobacter pfennigii TaxID=36849 RepID=A0A0P8W4U6_9CLOT|nr:hypothetical protein [Oxobacter pfennigii]KPU43604.1 hypothetical protein OXPF_30450 [Oxobacter pfennigii]